VAVGAFALALAALLVALVDTAPWVQRQEALSAADLARVQSLWKLADPRTAPEGKTAPWATTARDADLLLHEAASRLLNGAARVRLRTAAADVVVSVRIPRLPVSVWLNARATLHETSSGLPKVGALAIGRVPIPPSLAWWGVRTVAERQGWGPALQEGQTLVDHARIDGAGVVVGLRWSRHFVDTVRSALIPLDLHGALRAQSVALAKIVGIAEPSSGQALSTPNISLAALAPELFELAVLRTNARLGVNAAQTADPAARESAALENRAALITLAMYATGQPMARLVPAAREWPQPILRTVTLGGREDHPQHLLVSAVLAAEAGGRLADAIGVLKEVGDRAKGGSGFSFDDLAADRAGTRLGQRAVRDPFALQERLRRTATEAEVMPSVEGLPSFLTEAAFRAEVGGEGSARYEALKQEIERRVAQLPVLQ
jgi:hypothetical protein